MKKILYFFAALLIFAACEGPEGPAGADGVDGIDGVDGKDGKDGNVTCLACHADNVMETIQSQFYTSQHALGDIAVDYAGGRGSCAECHSHQGYVEWSITGDVADNFSAPEAWKCSTCHGLHKSFESSDYAFRAGGAVTLEDGTVIDKGNNNTCMNCHKARRGNSYYDSNSVATKDTIDTDDPIEIAEYKARYSAGEIAGAVDTLTDGSDFLVVFDIPTTHVFISSTHAGPHHGPQANVWAGVGAAGDVAGGAYSAHSGGCVLCHMGEASGHSFKPDMDNCTACHTSKETAMDAIGKRLEIIALALDAKHIVHIDDSWKSGDALYGAVHPIYASIPRAEFHAFWNFMTVMEDRSLSAHNPTYVKALLSQCESALGI